MGTYERPGYGFPSPLINPIEHVTKDVPVEEIVQEDSSEGTLEETIESSDTVVE